MALSWPCGLKNISPTYMPCPFHTPILSSQLKAASGCCLHILSRPCHGFCYFLCGLGRVLA